MDWRGQKMANFLKNIWNELKKNLQKIKLVSWNEENSIKILTIYSRDHAYGISKKPDFSLPGSKRGYIGSPRRDCWSDGEVFFTTFLLYKIFNYTLK
jgi:hypothetical protein